MEGNPHRDGSPRSMAYAFNTLVQVIDVYDGDDPAVASFRERVIVAAEEAVALGLMSENEALLAASSDVEGLRRAAVRLWAMGPCECYGCSTGLHR